MTEENMAGETPAAAAPAKAPPKAPTCTDLMLRAVAASTERNGVSFSALKGALAATGYDVEKNKTLMKRIVKSLVSKGTLLQVKGTGASGSFKINRELEKANKRAARARTAVARKLAAEIFGAKKSATAEKPAADKKSPKEAKKPAATKKEAESSKKEAKSPKKSAKKPTAAKKDPAQTAAKSKVKKAAPKKK